MNSRLIVRNLPKNIDEKQLRQHFSKFGEVTDLKIAQRGNVSRRFCFVGFKSEEAALKSKEYFNNTYVNMSKIAVEFAKTKDQMETIPEANTNIKRKNHNTTQDEPTANKKIKVEQSEKFKEFLDLMRSGAKGNMSWNDIVSAKNEKHNKKDQKATEKSKADKQKVEQMQTPEQRLEQLVKNKQAENKKETASDQKKVTKVYKLEKEGHGEGQPKSAQKASENSENTVDTKRLYVLNLPFQSTEEEVRALFQKYGEVTEIKMPKGDQGQFKGFCFVSYALEGEAIRAFSELDNKIVWGRILHVRPAFGQRTQYVSEVPKSLRTEIQITTAPEDREKSSYKKEQKAKLRRKLEDTTNWNTLFLNPNSVLEAVAAKYNLKKSEILALDAQSLAVRTAHAETQIIQETREWMRESGLNLSFLDTARDECKRADNVILVKNLAYTVSEQLLRETFAHFGKVYRVLLAPNRSIALVEFEEATHAQNAFTQLAYHPLKHNPLYLEWAPIDILDNNIEQGTNNVAKKDLLPQDQAMGVNDAAQEETVNANILFVKNLSFKTQDRDLQDFFDDARVGEIKSCRIVKKKDGKSSGYGFIEFREHESLVKALKKLQGALLDGHALELSHSRKKVAQQDAQKKKSRNLQLPVSNKLVVRNLAFEATKSEVRELFKSYGELKGVRLPKKMNGQHRGFAFVEFVSAEEARVAMDTLGTSHFYGRKLVIEWAQPEQTE